MANNKSIRQLEKRIVPILKRNGVVKASLFGSVVRGRVKKNSDIDILIQPPKGIGLGFVGIKLELEKELGRKVDLITYNSIHPYLKKYILADEVRII